MTRDELITRDGATCVWCGARPWVDDLTVEHLLPRSRGGRGRPENLVLACRTCNRRRRSRPVSGYARGLLREGRRPRLDLLAAALARLSGSPARDHADYGRRQLALVQRVAADVAGGAAHN